MNTDSDIRQVTTVTIIGLKSTPKTFRWGTIIRILNKYGADRSDINRIHRKLMRGRTAHFLDYKLQ